MDEKLKGASCALLAQLLPYLILYVLSAGPIVWLYDHRIITFETMHAHSAPITWFNRHIPIFAPEYNLYIFAWACKDYWWLLDCLWPKRFPPEIIRPKLKRNR